MLRGFSGHLVSEAFLEAHLGNPSTVANRPPADGARRALVGWRSVRAGLGPASSLRSMCGAAEPLAAALGFDAITDATLLESTIAATLRGRGPAAALLVTLWGDRLDAHWRTAVTEATARSAHWCLLFNGTSLRIVGTTRLFARRFAEFDIDQVLDDERACDALWILANVRALTSASVESAEGSLRSIVGQSDRHASTVCRALRENVLAASTEVLGALAAPRRRRGEADLMQAFEQALTIVYRLVFLLFAEARALLPLWHPVYRDSYSVDALRALVEGPYRSEGVWDTLRAMTRVAHAGCTAGDLRVTPFNGRLFAPARTPLANHRQLDDDAARRAVLALSTRQAAGGGRERIGYRDLGVEQLGAVYETLLDYEPSLEPRGDGRTAPRVEPNRVVLRSGSGVRKATGTFYTPQPIAEYLVRRTLGPLARDASPERILQLRVVDPAMGSGAFLVAACRYLAGAYEAALIRTGQTQPGEISDVDRTTFRRTIAERCLYGVDLNPMAVQLARLSLWLTTLASDRPLSFLDHRLQTGDSTLGVWLSALAQPPHPRRRNRIVDYSQPLLFDEPRFVNALHEVLPLRFSLESVPNDTIEAVRAKERAFETLTGRASQLSRWKQIADLWCAVWLTENRDTLPPETFSALSDAILTSRSALPPHAVQSFLQVGRDIAQRRRLFHWELEFPEVFFAADGSRLANAGFDAVIGNPPWEMMRMDTTASSSPHDDVRAAVRFTRDAGLYAAQSDGHANCYQLFVERSLALCRAGGRIGLVLPSGIATDRGSSALRRLLFKRADVDALVGFDNHRGVFPIHRSVRFVLLTATIGSRTDVIACRLGLDDPSELEGVGDDAAGATSWFPIHISKALLERFAGDDLTIPWFRDARDVALVERAHTLFPALGSAAGWSARFGRELNATEDRPAFNESRTGLPVVAGKQVQPYRVDLASSGQFIRANDALSKLRDGRHLRPRLTYRDVASATNRLTLIAAILPAGCVSTHTLFCLRSPLSAIDQHFLCGLFNSFVLNHLVRLQVTTHVTTGVVERLPVPTRAMAPRAVREIAALARHLARRADAIAEARLQARVAALYQLSVDEFAYVLSTFPLVPQEARDLALTTFTKAEGPAK